MNSQEVTFCGVNQPSLNSSDPMGDGTLSKDWNEPIGVSLRAIGHKMDKMADQQQPTENIQNKAEREREHREWQISQMNLQASLNG